MKFENIYTMMAAESIFILGIQAIRANSVVINVCSCFFICLFVTTQTTKLQNIFSKIFFQHLFIGKILVQSELKLTD